MLKSLNRLYKDRLSKEYQEEQHPRDEGGKWTSGGGKEDKGKPEPGKQYALTGGTGEPNIAAGNTWKESEVNPGKIAEVKEIKTGDNIKYTEKHGPYAFSYKMQVVGKPKATPEGISAKVKFTWMHPQMKDSGITLDEGAKSYKVGDVVDYHFKQENADNELYRKE